MSRAEVRSWWSRLPLLSALLPLHPKPWFYGQDLPLMCLSDRVSCISKSPGCHAGGFSRSAHFKARASWAVGGMEEAWGWTVRSMQICTTPLMENVTTIMNSIGRSSDPSSHLPHTCGLRWTLNVLRHTAASERELPTTADPPDHEVPATGAHKSDVPQLSTPKIRNWQRGVEKCIASRA
jgi:hypothetical protein